MEKLPFTEYEPIIQAIHILSAVFSTFYILLLQIQSIVLFIDM